MDGLEVIQNTSMFRGIAFQAILQKAYDLQGERDERLAEMIKSKIIKAWNDGQKK